MQPCATRKALSATSELVQGSLGLHRVCREYATLWMQTPVEQRKQVCILAFEEGDDCIVALSVRVSPTAKCQVLLKVYHRSQLKLQSFARVRHRISIVSNYERRLLSMLLFVSCWSLRSIS